MKQNIGISDRYIRFLFGLAFIFNIFILDITKGGIFILLAVGLSLFYSAYTGYSFIYDIFKLSSCGDESKSATS